MLSSRQRNDYQPVARDSLDAATTSDGSGSSLQSFDLEDAILKSPSSRRSIWSALCCSCFQRSRSPRRGRRRGKWRRLAFILLVALGVVIALTPIFNPSYSARPPHYTGTNPLSETVFIAANIIDEELIRGPWGDAVVELTERIGPQNVFLSIYENDSGQGTKDALQELGKRVKCKSEIVSGHIDLSTFPTVQFLPNDHRVKRIAYLAEVRNQALRPLDQIRTENNTVEFRNDAGKFAFDKLLFLNDIVFNPKDAMDLLFATNIDPGSARTRYHAACAMDFSNPFKFYDTFATRDAEMYRLGVPFFPWFTSSGAAESRADVLAGRDAVRVSSCWGGMAAFEARWFQAIQLEDHLQPLRFRYEDGLFWDASECCLIHADLHELTLASNKHADPERGIYVNPFIRVAYDPWTLSWLETTRRFERLYSLPHSLVNWLASMPRPALRRTEVPGALVQRREWVYDGTADEEKYKKVGVGRTAEFGHWEEVRRMAEPGGFCGYQQLFTLRNERKEGERMWEIIDPPKG